MNAADNNQLTQLLSDYAAGEQAALEQLIPLVYQELRHLAGRFLNNHDRGATLNTTALAHEAFEKLMIGQSRNYQNRVHFYAVCARVMRQIIFDHYRQRSAQKRGGLQATSTLDEQQIRADDSPDALYALGAALKQLEQLDPRLLETFELAHFTGLDNQQISEVTGLGLRTVQRDLSRAKAWISTALDQHA